MFEKYLNKLEYNKILDQLESYAKTYIGKDKCINLIPCKNVSFVLTQTYQAVSLIYKNGSIPLDSIPNISMPIKSLESNFSLNMQDLINVASILKTSRELKE